MPQINIALDGPAGAGKSTVARALAEKLDILYLDTGALYRAVGVAVQQAGIPPEDEAVVAALLPTLRITVAYQNKAQSTCLNGQTLGQELRTPEMSQLASKLSAQPAVRAHLLELQRQIATEHACVLDGRDIGTHVLPNCPHKFFITASLDARAQRRWLEEQQRGNGHTLEAVRADIADRDTRDANRAAAPLRQAEDAIYMDTSDMTPQDVVDAILQTIAAKRKGI